MQILFVSRDDVVRGPLARAFCQKHAHDMNVDGVAFDSAGTHVPTPCKPHPEIVTFLREQGLNLAAHVSKPLTRTGVRPVDLILTMTHEEAKISREIVGDRHVGKVVVLNDAVGFGLTPKDMDIRRLPSISRHELMMLYSQLKASTGRLVRMIADGDTSAADFGAVGSDTVPDHYLDDPHLRHFLSRYIVEFIERAFEAPASETIVEALAVMGRPVTRRDVEELIREDLKGKVVRDGKGRWEIDARVREDEERERKEKARRDRERQERDRAAEEKRAQGAKGRERPKAAAREEKLTVEQALDLLSVTLETPREDAQKTYRKLLMRYHPDKFQDDEEFRKMAEAKAKRINLAWALIEEKLAG